MNLKIKSAQRLEDELRVAFDFRADYNKAEQREMVECIAAKTKEARKTKKKAWFWL